MPKLSVAVVTAGKKAQINPFSHGGVVLIDVVALFQ